MMKSISVLLAIVIAVSSLLIPAGIARAESTLIIDGIVDEQSSLPTDSLGYQEFRDVSKTFNYSSGSVCISSRADSCSPVQIDDGIKVWINGVFLNDYLSRTQPVGPINIPASSLQPGINTIRIVLYDTQGPYRGGSPIYIVTGSTSTGEWLNNCHVIDVSPITTDQTEIEVYAGSAGPGLEQYIVTGYSLSGRRCEEYFSVTAAPSQDSISWELQGTLPTGQTVQITVDPKGSIGGYGVPISENLSYIYNVGDGLRYLFEWGEEYSHIVGDPSEYGVEITQSAYLLDRFKRKNPPQNYNVNPAYSLEALRAITAAFAAVGLIAARKSAIALSGSPSPTLRVLGQILFLIFTELPEEQPNLQAYHPQDTFLFTSYSPSRRARATVQVSEDVQQVVAQRIGVLSQFTTLSTISVRDRISAYTVFEYTAGGFTPHGPVMVTFGPPDGQQDVVWQIIKADVQGTIRSTIEMPEPSHVPLGQYVLIALDYETAEESVYDFVADPENATIRVTGAAALVEVVEDVTPPVTTATATGPRDANGVFRDAVTISFNATDDLSGVAQTEYSFDAGHTWTQVSPEGTLTINGNGITQFLYRSVDKYGNVEETKDSGPIVIHRYVAFANGTGTSMVFDRNSSVTINGDAHSNGSATVTSNIYLKLNGKLTTVNGTSQSGNIGTTVPVQSGALVPMLTYPMALYEQAATTVHEGDLVINSASQPLSGLYFVRGNIYLSAAKVTGDLTLVATGNIIDTSASSNFVNTDPLNGIMYYAGGNIELRSAKSGYLGLFYAPNGTVWLNRPSGGIVNGSFVGQMVKFERANSMTVKYDAGFEVSTHQLPLESPVW